MSRVGLHGYRVTVDGLDPSTRERFRVGTTEVCASSANQARSLGLGKLWDPRLDSAGCVPITHATRMSNGRRTEGDHYGKV